MWEKTITNTYPGIQKTQVWAKWADVNTWPSWDHELEYCDLKDDFKEGSQFVLKPKGGPKVKIYLYEVTENQSFSNYCKFIGARMDDIHLLEDTPEGLKITNTIKVTGPLSFLWAYCVGKKVAAAIPEQTARMIEMIRSEHV